MGGYAKISQIRGVGQEVDAQQDGAAQQEAGVPADRRRCRNRRQWLDERQRCRRIGGNATTSQTREAQQQGEQVDRML
jgi:hypothetical protein